MERREGDRRPLQLLGLSTGHGQNRVGWRIFGIKEIRAIGSEAKILGATVKAMGHKAWARDALA